MRPFYVPLMQGLVTHVATSATPAHNVLAGRPLLAYLDDADEKQNVTVLTPGGKTHRLQATRRGGRVVAEFSDTRRPGVYTMTAQNDRVMHFVVTTDRAESRLERLPKERLDAIATAFGATVVRNGDEYASIEQTRRHGREVWKPLLACVLALMFAELWLAQKFARSKS